ncbi:50S ribosomal protein L11 methyltransferase [Asticcacaulis sp. BYS171W]|uniref:50S ribosomal protein L11 methyltransferase n=1 Tax=Asticcacaulis aquaticus TaxID=2984212 RepID=A0ABT5HSD8_9CAUL|nr:50S ribosomal protein L11 methyltransferase [Asticcacaulis aquaticus]MDC7682982.1 50S ribosomal protein L11 methyltransferase [Asticcacaulis aquaticus]
MLTPAPSVPDISLYQAHAHSGLRRLVGDDGPSPYWAFGWAGGTVLARYILDHPQVVKGRRVFDLGTGSGIVAVAAMKAGAASVMAVDVDPLAALAARLNAEANGVLFDIQTTDYLDGAPPDCDVMTVGDVFFEAGLALRVTAFLTRCQAAGVEILVGDPGRKPLPLNNLEHVAGYDVPDFGQSGVVPAKVYRFRSAAS